MGGMRGAFADHLVANSFTRSWDDQHPSTSLPSLCSTEFLKIAAEEIKNTFSWEGIQLQLKLSGYGDAAGYGTRFVLGKLFGVWNPLTLFGGQVLADEYVSARYVTAAYRTADLSKNRLKFELMEGLCSRAFLLAPQLAQRFFKTQIHLKGLSGLLIQAGLLCVGGLIGEKLVHASGSRMSTTPLTAAHIALRFIRGGVMITRGKALQIGKLDLGHHMQKWEGQRYGLPGIDPYLTPERAQILGAALVSTAGMTMADGDPMTMAAVFGTLHSSDRNSCDLRPKIPGLETLDLFNRRDLAQFAKGRVDEFIGEAYSRHGRLQEEISRDMQKHSHFTLVSIISDPSYYVYGVLADKLRWTGAFEGFGEGQGRALLAVREERRALESEGWTLENCRRFELIPPRESEDMTPYTRALWKDLRGFKKTIIDNMQGGREVRLEEVSLAVAIQQVQMRHCWDTKNPRADITAMAQRYLHHSPDTIPILQRQRMYTRYLASVLRSDSHAVPIARDLPDVILYSESRPVPSLTEIETTLTQRGVIPLSEAKEVVLLGGVGDHGTLQHLLRNSRAKITIVDHDGAKMEQYKRAIRETFPQEPGLKRLSFVVQDYTDLHFLKVYRERFDRVYVVHPNDNFFEGGDGFALTAPVLTGARGGLIIFTDFLPAEQARISHIRSHLRQLGVTTHIEENNVTSKLTEKGTAFSNIYPTGCYLIAGVRETPLARTLEGAKLLESLRSTRSEGREGMPTQAQNLGRNDPCHCGSGVKYKKCCLPLDGVR